ncbi:MAG: carbon-nitrogen hydrolase family protein, partial [Verrucomicrobia bacterium]|nr:carbon-nitrogen hydrolase family protein [Verrucomicrobiota bacterium]
IQMREHGGAKESNLSRAENFVAAARAAGADVVMQPETLNLGWTHRSAPALADELPGGEACARLQAAAQRHSVFLCAGLVERAGERLFNSAVLIGPEGAVLLHHRKLNELDIAHDLYAQGDRLAVAHTPRGTFGLMICADAFARGQVVSRTLGLMGADIILSPCAWAVPADHDNGREPYGRLWLDNYGPPARDFRMWIAGCSNVGWIDDGPWQGRKCIGCSLVIGPDGKPALRGPYGVEAETMLMVDVTLDSRRTRGDTPERARDAGG